MLETFLVPACFVAAGLLGYRLGTPARVAGGLVALGGAHLLAFITAGLALAARGAAADVVHLASQLLFLGGFVALVWLAASYPDSKPARKLVVAAAALGTAGPVLAAASGPTPAILDSTRSLGPVVQLLPASIADIAVVSLMLLPVLAVATFVARYRRAEAHDRAAMRWPIAGLGVLAALVFAGSLAGSERQALVTFLFLLGAPVLPLSLAFGPVIRRLDALSDELADVRDRLSRQVRPEAAPGALSRLTPRELTVLQAMAEGRSNPEIARRMHLSLSSVEKHATAIFRKLDITDAPETHRRVSAVIAYRNALETGPEGSHR